MLRPSTDSATNSTSVVWKPQSIIISSLSGVQQQTHLLMTSWLFLIHQNLCRQTKRWISIRTAWALVYNRLEDLLRDQ